MPLPNGLAILIYLSIPLHDYPLLDCEVVNSLVMGFVLIVAFKSTARTRNTAVGGAEAPHVKQHMASFGNLSLPLSDILPDFTVRLLEDAGWLPARRNKVAGWMSPPVFGIAGH